MPIRVDPNDLFPPSLHTGLLAQADQAGGQHQTRWRRIPGAIQLRPRGHGGGRDAHPLPEVGQHLCHQTCVLPSGLQLTWGVWPENVQPSLNPQNSSLGAAVRAGLQAERVHPLGMAGAHVIEIVFSLLSCDQTWVAAALPRGLMLSGWKLWSLLAFSGLMPHGHNPAATAPGIMSVQAWEKQGGAHKSSLLSFILKVKAPNFPSRLPFRSQGHPLLQGRLENMEQNWPSLDLCPGSDMLSQWQRLPPNIHSFPLDF